MSTTTKKKLPRAKVAVFDTTLHDGAPYLGAHQNLKLWHPVKLPHTFCTVTPHPTKSAAQARAKFENLTWEQKVERVAESLYNPNTIIGSLGTGKWRQIEWTDCDHDRRIKAWWLSLGRAVLLAQGYKEETK